MTDEQARRIAQLNARRSSPASQTGIRSSKPHKARKSRALVLGLSVAAASGLISGMWTNAAMANAEPVNDVALQPVVVPGAAGQPDQIVYLVVTRPAASSGADTLRTNSVQSSQSQVQVPAQTSPAPSTPAPAPVTRSHGSR